MTEEENYVPVSQRIFPIVFGAFLIAFSVFAIFNGYSWILVGILCLTGIGVVFVGFRGRKDDLRDLTPKQFAVGIFGEVLGYMLVGFVILICILVWRFFR